LIKGILISKTVCKDYIVAKFELEKEINVEPGQFLMLTNKTEPVMAKPFSVVSCEKNILTVLIRVIGRFTNFLKNDLMLGDHIYFRGSYGNSYYNTIISKSNYILIGAGCGSAPLLHFEKKYKDSVVKSFYGFRNDEITKIMQNENFFFDEIEKKNIIETAYEYFVKNSENIKGIISSGTFNMNKAVFDKFKNFDLEIYCALDERMGCGVGMCKGCPIKIEKEIKMICKDGPLFDARKIDFNWNEV